MHKILFLLNNLSSYSSIVIKLMKLNEKVNLLEGYTTRIISEIRDMDYDIIVIEDDNKSNFAINNAILLARASKKASIILISDTREDNLDSGIDYIVAKDIFMKKYIELFKSFGVNMSGDELHNNEVTVSDLNKNIINEGKNIILVDDDIISASILSSIISKEGYNVKTFSSAIDMLRGLNEMSIDNEKIDLIILDLMMPIIDGFSLLKKIRRLDSYSDIPVLISSARNDPMSVVKVAKYKVNGYILKPYDKTIIIERIKSLIG